MSQGSTKGVPIDTDSTMSANSDALVPSQKAVKSLVLSLSTLNVNQAQTVSYFDRLPNYPTTNSYQIAFDNLFKGLISNNQLQYFDAIYILANQDYASAYKNFVKNNYTITDLGSPAFFLYDSLKGNGISNLLRININPNTTIGLNYALNDAHLGVYIRSCEIEAKVDIGAFDNTNGAWITSQFTNDTSGIRLNSASAVIVSGTKTSRGYFIAERNNSANILVKKDGVTLGTFALASSAVPNVEFGIFALNGPTPQAYSSKNISIAHVGKSGLDAVICKQLFDNFLIAVNVKINYWHFYGDSVTLGVGASISSNKWSSLLCSHYNVSEDNFGAGGMTASQTYSNHIDYTTIKGKSAYDKYLFITFGLNEWNTGCTPTTFENGLTGIITTAISRGWSASDIKITSDFFLPTVNLTYAIYDALILKMISVSATYGIQFLDFYNYGKANGGNSTWLSADFVHPTDLGYSKKYQFLKTNLII